MNSGSYPDPKFLANEEYPQAGYVHHSGPDYYQGHAGNTVQYPNNYPVNSQAAAIGYTREAAVMGYTGYYPQCSALAPHHMQMAANAHIPNSLVGLSASGNTVSAGNSSSASATIPSASTALSGTHSTIPRSPGSSPVPTGGPNNNNSSLTGSPPCTSANHQSPQSQSQHLLGYTGGQSTPQPQLTPGGGDGMSSDCSDDEGSPQGSGGQMPVVYPWMKKIHVAGAGKQI